MSDSLLPALPNCDHWADTAFLFEPPAAPWPDRGLTPPFCRFHAAIPTRPLAEFVDAVWLWQGGPVVGMKERVLPTGTMQLVFDLGDARAAPMVCGPQSAFSVVDTAGFLVGVHFKPGGAYPLLGVPASEFRDANVPLNTLWGSGASALRERLFEAETPGAKLRALEQALRVRAAQPFGRHPAVAYALAEIHRGPPTPSVGELTERVGLTRRQFLQAFTDEVGLTPKLYCRIRRFQEALRRVRFSRRVEWVGVALECGYYDQAHFIRDFQEFSGFRPTAYLQAWAEHLRHVAHC